MTGFLADCLNVADCLDVADWLATMHTSWPDVFLIGWLVDFFVI